MITRSASATWNGDLTGGDGTVRSHTLDHPYSFATRFGDEKGTNPDELVGAALASCFAMALANDLAEAGHTPTSVDASARVHLDPDVPAIVRIDLDVEGRVPGLDADAFREAARGAKENCPVSKALGGVEIVLGEVKLTDA
ncbi:MAG: OsmC family peroxiredoxin [Gemmatimonadota bacterium]